MRLSAHQRGAVWNAAGSVMFAVNSVAMLIAVSQTSDVQTVGNYGIALTVAQLLYTVGAFGATNLQMTDYQKGFSFADYARLKLMSVLGMMVLCAMIVLIDFSSGQKALFTLLLTVFYLLESVGDLYQSQFFRNDRLDLSGQSVFFRTLLSLIAFITAITLTRDVAASLAVLLICNLACTYVLAIRRARGFVGAKTPFDSRSLRRLIGQAVLLFLSDFLSGFTLGVPRFCIDRLLDDTAQGYYALIFMPVFTINLLSLLLFKPALARCARLLEKRELGAFWKLVARQAAMIVVLTLLALVVVQLVGIPILSWLYGIDLAPVKLDLVIITAGGGFVALCNIGYFLLVILRRQRSILVIYGLGLAAAFVLCTLLTLAVGLTGTCWGFVLSYGLLFMLFALFTRSALRRLARSAEAPGVASGVAPGPARAQEAAGEEAPTTGEGAEYSLRQRQERLLDIFKAFIALCARHDVTYYACGGTAIGAVRHQGFIPWDDDIDIFMLREDYLKLRAAADTELEGTNYRLYSCEDSPDYHVPFPSFVDISTEYVPMPMRASGDPKYLKLGVDLFIFENVPEDERAFKRFRTKAWVLGKLYFISVTPHPDIPFKNRVARRLCAAVMFGGHYVFRVLPFLRDRLVKSWNRHCARYYGKTARFALLIDTWPTRYRVSKEDLYPPIVMSFEGIAINMAKNYDAMLRNDYGDYLAMPPESERKTHPAYRLRLAAADADPDAGTAVTDGSGEPLP